MSRTFVIARGVVANWLGTVANAVIGMLIVPLLLARFGKEGYGLISLVGVVTGVRTYLGFGLAGALQRELSAVGALGDREQYNTLLSTSLVIYLIMGLTFGGFCFVAAPLVVRWLNAPPSAASTAMLLVRWYAAPTIVLSFVSPLYASVLASNNRFDLLHSSVVTAVLCKGLALFAMLKLTSLSFAGWASIVLASQILEVGLQRYAARRIWAGLQLRLRAFSARSARSLFSLGLQLFLLRLIDILGITTDPMVLTSFLGPAAVALYSPPASLANQPKPIIDSLKSQLDPISSASFATGRMQDLQQILIRGTRLRLLPGILACVTTAVFAWPIQHVWLGRTLHASDVLITSRLLVLWSIIHLCTYAAGTQWPVLTGMRRVAFLAKTELPFAVVNLLASIYLVGFTRLGVVGVLIPTAVTAIIKRPISTVYCARQVGLPVSQYLKSAYARPLVVLVLLSMLAQGLRVLVQPTTLSALLLAAVITTVMWLVLCWYIGLERVDKESIGVLTKGLLRRQAA